MSPSRQKTSEPAWHAPSDEQLVVLHRQIEEAIADGEAIMPKPREDDGWGPWDTNLGDLIERAFGPKSAQANDYHYASGGPFGGGPDRRDYSNSEAYEQARVADRNESITGKIAAARGTLKAIDQEMERRGVRIPEGGAALPTESFAFVGSEPTRAIAQRDYDELRAASRTVKARALLAGSVVEAVLLDALERKGYTTKQVGGMSFRELIEEARKAKVISERTAKVADSLRDLRNLVHPAVELREGRLRGPEADAAVSLMRLVLEDLR